MWLPEKKEKIRPTQNTQLNPQQPDYRDQLQTLRKKTRLTRYPLLARFCRYRVCGSRPRTARAINKNDDCYAYTQTDGQTD